MMDRIIKVLEREIRLAQKQFDKVKQYDNYAQMAVYESYRNGLEQARVIVEMRQKEVKKIDNM